MSESETALLRKELAKAVAENREWQARVARLEAAFAKRGEMLVAEIDRLRLENAGLNRRLARYENHNAPSSTDSLYNKERAAFRKRMEMEERAGPDDGPEPEDGGGGTGPTGAARGARGQVPREQGREDRYAACEQVRDVRARPPQAAAARDEACLRLSRRPRHEGRVRRVRDREGAVQEVRRGQRRPGSRDTGHLPWPEGPGVCGGVLCQEGHRRDIAYFFKALYGFDISPNAVWNARRALNDLLKDTYGKILGHIAEAPFVQFDGSVFKMNGRKGYVWLVTAGDATYLVAAPSRAAAVLDLHFGSLLGIPVVSDGYVVYEIFPVRQGYWVHILREAEKLAIRNGGDGLSCHRRLLSLYRRIRDRESADSAECLDLERAVLRIAAAYGDGHKFRGTLEGAAPHLFMFLRYPGMPPRNNGVELEIRDSVVLHRNVRHQLSEPEGREVFSVLCIVPK